MTLAVLSTGRPIPFAIAAPTPIDPSPRAVLADMSFEWEALYVEDRRLTQVYQVTRPGCVSIDATRLVATDPESFTERARDIIRGLRRFEIKELYAGF